MRSARSDIVKILVFFAGSLLLGGLLAPWLYQAGKAFAEVAASHATSPVAGFLADAASRSDFQRFFDRAVLIAACVLLLPTIHWLRVGRGRFRDTPWSLRIPDAVVDRGGQPLRPNPHGWRDGIIGALIAAGLLLLVGVVLLGAGWFRWRESANPVLAAAEALPSAIIVSFVEEIIFRGVLLGVFLRAMRPTTAITSLAFVFACVHFLEPPAGVVIADPGATFTGIRFLGLIFSRFGDPIPLISEFGILLAIGVVLGYARWRTASLWLPAGLHSGWVFALIFFKNLTLPVASLAPQARYLVGLTLREGIVPTVVVLATGVLVHALTTADARRLHHTD